MTKYFLFFSLSAEKHSRKVKLWNSRVFLSKQMGSNLFLQFKTSRRKEDLQLLGIFRSFKTLDIQTKGKTTAWDDNQME